MSNSNILVYLTTWCGDCRRTLTYLDSLGVAYTAINIDNDPAAAQVVMKLNHGFRSVPTLVFPDGSHLTEPSNYQITAAIKKLAQQ